MARTPGRGGSNRLPDNGGAPPRLQAPPKGAAASGSGGGPRDDEFGKDWVLGVIEASEKKTATELQKLESKMDAKLESLPTKWEAVLGGIALFGAILAVMAWGANRFDGGAQFTSYSVQQTVEAKKLAEDNARQINKLSEDNARQINMILDLLRKKIDSGDSAKPK